MASWQRIVHSTIRKYLRTEEVNILRNRKLTALLKERGRITYNVSGESLDWKVRYRRTPMVGYADGDTLTFARQNKRKTVNLDWRGYSATDSMTKLERLQNRNTEAIIKLYSNISKELVEDIEDQFGDELYVDGNAAGNSKRIHGLESCLGDDGSTTASDSVAAPSDTYGGLNTSLGNYGGSWSGTWPDGTGDAHYDFWSPVLVNYTSDNFGPTNHTFAEAGDEAVRFMIIQCQKNKSRRGMLDLILLTRTLYTDLLNLLDSKERFVSRPGRQEGSLAKLGFTDMVNYDGVEVTWEYGVPDTVGYGINVDMMELMCMQDQLFVPEGPDYDVASKSYRFGVDFFGNLKLNPRSLGKLDDYAT